LHSFNHDAKLILSKEMRHSIMQLAPHAEPRTDQLENGLSNWYLLSYFKDLPGIITSQATFCFATRASINHRLFDRFTTTLFNILKHRFQSSRIMSALKGYCVWIMSTLNLINLIPKLTAIRSDWGRTN